MPGNTDCLRDEDVAYHQGREGTHRDCAIKLAFSRYDRVFIVEVQDNFPTSVVGKGTNVRREKETAYMYTPTMTWASLMRATARQR